jgi:hypothetical protein
MDYWPIVVLTAGDNPSDAEYEAMFADWEKVYTRRERFVSLVDAREAKSMVPAKQRAKLAAWAREIEPLTAEFLLGSAKVIVNPLARGAMTAVQWLHKPKAPELICATMLEACDFCIARLDEARIPLTPAIRAYRARLARA